MSDDRYYFNGIDAETGNYLAPPLTEAEIAALVRGTPIDTRKTGLLRRLWETISTGHYALPLDRRPEHINEVGWAVVLHRDEDPGVKTALEPLISHRAKQVGNDKLARVLEYRGDEDVAGWLNRHGTSLGDEDPTKVPFYVLLIGGPERIPFDFQQILDLGYAVGRLHFDDPDAYGRYAQSVVAYEEGQGGGRTKEAVFFATRHEFDPATRMSADLMVTPLADGDTAAEPPAPPVAERWGYETRKLWGPEATKAALLDTLAGRDAKRRPTFLFSASHGLGYRFDSATYKPETQRANQGALITQDWPGFGDFRPEHCVAAADIADDFDVHGLIGFLFACYSAGTPSHDRFMHKKNQTPAQIASTPFTAALPQALLGHPNGSALACIGHVERAWGASVLPGRSQQAQLLAFRNAVGRILIGHPIGLALQNFNDRNAQYSARLAELLEDAGFGSVSESALASAWLLRNDAQGYVLLGDPAVRLRPITPELENTGASPNGA